MKRQRRHHLAILITIALFLANSLTGLAAEPKVQEHEPAKSTKTAPPSAVPGVLPRCQVPAITMPKAAPIPGAAELDPTTGLHYTGNGEVISLDPDTYRLAIDGMVDFPFQLRLDDLRCLPRIEIQTTIVCKGNFEDTSIWAGASLKYLLEMAGIQAQAKNIRMVSADGYQASVTREDAMAGKAFLAYEWRTQPVPIIHGFPVRAAFPGLLGANWVKWLVKIEVF